jgi:DNA-3-methyladenine glycosylase I
VDNAAAVLDTQLDHGSFAAYLWAFVDDKPVQNAWRALADLPAETDLSKRISRELKRRGFRFVGPTTIYSFLQAAGFVNDHVVDCFRWPELTADSAD